MFIFENIKDLVVDNFDTFDTYFSFIYAKAQKYYNIVYCASVGN